MALHEIVKYPVIPGKDLTCFFCLWSLFSFFMIGVIDHFPQYDLKAQ